MWMEILLVIFFVDGKAINECRLFLQTLATATCQLYLALLPLRHAAQHFAKAAGNIFIEPCVNVNDSDNISSTKERMLNLLSHVLQGALFLILSTARWLQKMLLFKDDVDEWVKEQNQERERIEEQRRQVEEYLNYKG
ncbi:hypothetical protein F2P79_017793 [Pimephales promelas]|nr:hypothetical protein F2P79_017793 [Pimephales promelas]